MNMKTRSNADNHDLIPALDQKERTLKKVSIDDSQIIKESAEID